MAPHFSNAIHKKSSLLIKYFFLFVLLFTGSIAVSQEEFTNDFIDEYEEFDFYAKPDKTNKLSRYFRNRIDTRMLKEIKFKQKDTRNQRIFLRFSLNSKKEPVYIKVSSPYSELNTSIREAFEKYDINKLNIPDINPLNGYLLQIISKEGNNTIVNCNSTIIYDRFPVFEGCESVANHGAMRKCINKQLEKHIVKNISAKELEKANVFGDVKLTPRFRVNTKGDLSNIKSLASTRNLGKELDRVVALFPAAKIPAMRNGNPSSIYIRGNVSLQIDSKDKNYEDKIIKSKNPNLKTDNDLALYFKQHITDTELKDIAFYRKQKSIKISFGINKKGKLMEVKTNLRNIKMNAKLVRLFKKYPLGQLNIERATVHTLYSYNIITKSTTKNVIQCNDVPYTTVFPVFNKKCETSKSPGDLKKCFSDNMSAFVKKEFDSKLANKTNLTGKIKMYALFKVDEIGNIIIHKVKAPNPFLSNGLRKILDNIPAVYKPGTAMGKITTTKLSLPVIYTRRSTSFETAKPFKTREARY